MPVSKALAEALVYSQFPRFAQLRAHFVGEGWDNIVWAFGDTAFRFPHRSNGVEATSRELQLLPWLHKRLPKMIPNPAYVGQPTEAFQRTFYGYRQITGESSDALELTPEDRRSLTKDLATFLARLHTTSAAEFLQLGGSKRNRLEEFTPLMEATRRRFDVLRGSNLEWLISLVDDVLRQCPKPLPNSHQCVVHGDLYFRHFLLNADHTLSGVIDWGAMSVCDRRSDLELVFGFLPPDQRSTFLDEYYFAGAPTVSEGTLEGARGIAACTAIHMGAYAVDVGDQGVIRELSATAKWIAE